MSKIETERLILRLWKEEDFNQSADLVTLCFTRQITLALCIRENDENIFHTSNIFVI